MAIVIVEFRQHDAGAKYAAVGVSDDEFAILLVEAKGEGDTLLQRPAGAGLIFGVPRHCRCHACAGVSYQAFSICPLILGAECIKWAFPLYLNYVDITLFT